MILSQLLSGKVISMVSPLRRDLVLRLPKRTRDQLVYLKRKTKVKHYHVLCRWAFCLSVQDDRPPRDSIASSSEDFEIQLGTFGQSYAEIYWDLGRQKVIAENLDVTEDNIRHSIELHIQRGMARMGGPGGIRSISDLVQFAIPHGGKDAPELSDPKS